MDCEFTKDRNGAMVRASAGINMLQQLKKARTKLAPKVRQWWPVWFYALNREGRREWRTYPALHKLNVAQQRVAKDLERDGIATAHITELFSDEQFGEMKARAIELLDTEHIQNEIRTRESAGADTGGAEETKAGKAGKEEVIVHILGDARGNMPSLRIGDPLMSFALDEVLISVAGTYLSMLPKFKALSLNSTVLLPKDAPKFFSQRWHRDPDDKSLLKVFLYFNDVVDEGGGPFTYVKGSHNGGRWGHLFPQEPPAGSYPPPGGVERSVPADEIKMCTGKAGTLVFADTAGLHRGGFSTTKRRLMLTAVFTPPAARIRKNYTIENVAARKNLSQAAEFVTSQ